MTDRQRARQLLANHIERQGEAWLNTANAVRTGFENVWVRPALDALEATLRLVPDDEG